MWVLPCLGLVSFIAILHSPVQIVLIIVLFLVKVNDSRVIAIGSMRDTTYKVMDWTLGERLSDKLVVFRY